MITNDSGTIFIFEKQFFMLIYSKWMLCLVTKPKNTAEKRLVIVSLAARKSNTQYKTDSSWLEKNTHNPTYGLGKIKCSKSPMKILNIEVDDTIIEHWNAQNLMHSDFEEKSWKYGTLV